MVYRGIVRVAAAIAYCCSATAAWPQAADKAANGTFTDQRDGQIYPTVKLAGMVWFARDLNHETPQSFCYGDLEKNCDVYGRLYRWEAALSACPAGWHLSTEYEWRALERWLGMDEDYLENYGNRGRDQGARLKKGGDTGFSVTYGGWRRSEDGEYEALGKNAAYWEATDSSFGRAWHRDIDVGDDMIWRSPVIKPYALSVRCVKNHFETDEAPAPQ